jgi:antitoxin ParD1/3/4
MNVSLTRQLERFIGKLVKSGRYRSASEVVRDAVRLLQQRDEEREGKLAALRQAIGMGVDELDRGNEVSGEEVFEDILRALKGSEVA